MKMVIAISLLSSVSAWAGYDYEITSGYVWELTLEDSETLLMTGGGGYTLTGLDNSKLYIQNTSSPVIVGESGIGDLMVGNNSQLNFSGGYVAHLTIGGNTTAILSGGQISIIYSSFAFPADSSHITVYCQSGWTYQNGYLSGLWQDDTAFNIKLVTKSGSDIFSNMTIIPEPATMLLLVVGGLLLKRKK